MADIVYTPTERSRARARRRELTQEAPLLARLDWVMLATVLGSTDAGGSGPIRARNATGGPVKPATTRDYVLVTIFFAIAIAAIFVGLYFMRR